MASATATYARLRLGILRHPISPFRLPHHLRADREQNSPENNPRKPSTVCGYVVRNAYQPLLVPFFFYDHVSTVDLCSAVVDTFEHTTLNPFFLSLYRQFQRVAPQGQHLPPDHLPLLLPILLHHTMKKSSNVTRMETRLISAVSSVQPVLP